MSTTDMQMEPHFRKSVAEIDNDITKLVADAARLQTTRDTIVELYGGETEVEEAPAPTKHTYKKRGGQPPSSPAALDVRAKVKVRAGAEPGQSTEARLADEPETLGAAMKLVAKQLGKFTSSQLREAMKEKYQKLFEDVGPSVFSGNLAYWLAYWVKSGKLTLLNENYTVVNLDF